MSEGQPTPNTSTCGRLYCPGRYQSVNQSTSQPSVLRTMLVPPVPRHRLFLVMETEGITESEKKIMYQNSVWHQLLSQPPRIVRYEEGHMRRKGMWSSKAGTHPQPHLSPCAPDEKRSSTSQLLFSHHPYPHHSACSVVHKPTTPSPLPFALLFPFEHYDFCRWSLKKNS